LKKALKDIDAKSDKFKSYLGGAYHNHAKQNLYDLKSQKYDVKAQLYSQKQQAYAAQKY